MAYQLLAVDMDGTLLNSQKEVSARSRQSINAALARGKTVVFSTGRCIAELEHFFPLFPRMRYVLCESGACVYDLAQKRALYQRIFEPDVVQPLLDYAVQQDLLLQFFSDTDVFLLLDDAAQLRAALQHVQLEQYFAHFVHCAQLTSDYTATLRARGWRVSKVNLYHSTETDCEMSMRALAALPVTMVRAEAMALECSPRGIDKGCGLDMLCRHLHIPLEQTIAVGDSFNDETMLRRAGLSVAMGNAAPEIKALCDVTTADCNHDGVAQVIEQYL